jgi:hypothetical protein
MITWKLTGLNQLNAALFTTPRPISDDAAFFVMGLRADENRRQLARRSHADQWFVDVGLKDCCP